MVMWPQSSQVIASEEPVSRHVARDVPPRNPAQDCWSGVQKTPLIHQASHLLSLLSLTSLCYSLYLLSNFPGLPLLHFQYESQYEVLSSVQGHLSVTDACHYLCHFPGVSEGSRSSWWCLASPCCPAPTGHLGGPTQREQSTARPSCTWNKWVKRWAF